MNPAYVLVETICEQQFSSVDTDSQLDLGPDFDWSNTLIFFDLNPLNPPGPLFCWTVNLNHSLKSFTCNRFSVVVDVVPICLPISIVILLLTSSLAS